MLAKSLIQDFPYSFLVYTQLLCLAITPVRWDQINITDAEKFIWKVVDSINNTVSKMLLVSYRVMVQNVVAQNLKNHTVSMQHCFDWYFLFPCRNTGFEAKVHIFFLFFNILQCHFILRQQSRLRLIVVKSIFKNGRAKSPHGSEVHLPTFGKWWWELFSE